MTIEFRRLKIRDLGTIEEIERSAYPTPWSRSMFAGELAKPSSICLGAIDVESNRLVGYLIISRYVDAWHVMNIAVAHEYRRRGIAMRLMERLFEITSGDADRGRARHRGRSHPRQRRLLAGRPARALRRRRAGDRLPAAPRARRAGRP